MDIVNNLWYQLMYRNPNYEPCNQYNETGLLYGDLLTIDIKTAKLLNTVHICVSEIGNVTCPISIEYWNAN